MVMVYPIELISRGCSLHQFKLHKEHRAEWTRGSHLLVISMSSCNVHLIITRTLFIIGLQLRSGKSPTRNDSIYFTMFI